MAEESGHLVIESLDPVARQKMDEPKPPATILNLVSPIQEKLRKSKDHGTAKTFLTHSSATQVG